MTFTDGKAKVTLGHPEQWDATAGKLVGWCGVNSSHKIRFTDTFTNSEVGESGALTE